jgi:hypothetical protein
MTMQAVAFFDPDDSTINILCEPLGLVILPLDEARALARAIDFELQVAYETLGEAKRARALEKAAEARDALGLDVVLR